MDNYVNKLGAIRLIFTLAVDNMLVTRPQNRPGDISTVSTHGCEHRMWIDCGRKKVQLGVSGPSWMDITAFTLDGELSLDIASFLVLARRCGAYDQAVRLRFGYMHRRAADHPQVIQFVFGE